jgi:uncharacterized protein YgbK (DUF1537 family)
VSEFVRSGGAALALDPLAFAGRDAARDAVAWAKARLGRDPVLVYTTADPEAVRRVQLELGVEAAGALVERTLGEIASGLVQEGVRRLVVAGGETAGAVMQALGVERLRIGPQIDPGVPWCAARSPLVSGALHLALKSGNFGAPDFFTKSFAMLEAHAPAESVRDD